MNTRKKKKEFENTEEVRGGPLEENEIPRNADASSELKAEDGSEKNKGTESDEDFFIHAKQEARVDGELSSPNKMFRKFFGDGGIRKKGKFAALFLLALSGGIYWYFSAGEKKIPTSSLLLPEVKTSVVAFEKLSHEIEVPGTLTFLEKAAVNSKVPGRVQKIYADMGGKVRAGERLALMETFELRLKLRQTLAGVNSARARVHLSQARYRAARRNIEKQFKSLERMQADILNARATFINARRNLLNKKEIYELGGLAKTDITTAYAEYLSAMGRLFQSRKDYQASVIGFRDQDITATGVALREKATDRRKQITDLNTEVEKNELLSAEAGYESALLELSNIRMMLREALIKSPLAGVVASRNIETGEEIKPGEPLFTVVRMDVLVVSTSITEKNKRYIREGQKVRLRVDALDGEVFEGTVYRIAPVIDVKTRSAEVRIKVKNKKHLLNPGMFVRCGIIIRRREKSLALPEEAIHNIVRKKSELQGEIFLLKDGLAFKRKVLLGELFGDRREVVNGLKPGDEVVVRGGKLLKDGAKVRVLRDKKNPSTRSPNKKQVKEKGS